MPTLRWKVAALLPALLGSAVALGADDWLSAGGDASGSYHSTLTDINTQTVSRLGFAWDLPLDTHRGQEATPLVADGVLYTVGNFGRVYAVDAAAGTPLWTYDPGADGQFGRYACCDVVNRGVALRNGIVYVESWMVFCMRSTRPMAGVCGRSTRSRRAARPRHTRVPGRP